MAHSTTQTTRRKHSRGKPELRIAEEWVGGRSAVVGPEPQDSRGEVCGSATRNLRAFARFWSAYTMGLFQSRASSGSLREKLAGVLLATFSWRSAGFGTSSSTASTCVPARIGLLGQPRIAGGAGASVEGLCLVTIPSALKIKHLERLLA